MQFDVLDRRMRVFETAHDHKVLPGMFMVARLDGRNFTHLTRDVHQFDAPFDERFRDYMVATAMHLMQCGFRTVYGYTQSDEISILFHRGDTTFDRKLRKYVSVLAGEASTAFALQLGAHAAFDCRISQLPAEEYVIDYFRWRSEDAHRNALNAHCYWMLRAQGQSVSQATDHLHRLSVAGKNELLFKAGINFNDLPHWQKRGIGILWTSEERPAVNPQTGAATVAQRRRLAVEFNLPLKEEYDAFIRGLLHGT
jgi:tRNA(His) 5'-end guanylyltransferase